MESELRLICSICWVGMALCLQQQLGFSWCPLVSILRIVFLCGGVVFYPCFVRFLRGSSVVSSVPFLA